MVAPFSIFCETSILFPINLDQLTSPTVLYEGSFFSSLAFIISGHFVVGHFQRCEVVSPYGFDTHFRDDKW